jgi:hypothetical protein
MVNPIKAVKAVKNFTGGKKGRAIENKVRKEFGMSKGITAGKVKSVKKREIAKMMRNTNEGVGGGKVFRKATSNKKLGASLRAGRGFNPSKVKKMVKEEKKAGYAMEPKWFNLDRKDKARNPYQISGPNKKIPVKRRGK